MSTSDSSEKSEYELLREKNIREREAFFASLKSNEEHINALKDINDLGKALNTPKPKRRRKVSNDESFRFGGYIPETRRKSARLAKQSPSENYVLEEEEEFPKYTPKKKQMKKRRSFTSRAQRPIMKPPEAITEEDIAKIAVTATRKVYCPTGTTCHQCRQKTADTKTICRSGFCIGIRGQFCGPCLRGRYAESVAVALKDPKWACPGCRDECNCSFCRANAGKPPTGILAPLARGHGYESVKHFLQELEGNLIGYEAGGKAIMR